MYFKTNCKYSDSSHSDVDASSMSGSGFVFVNREFSNRLCAGKRSSDRVLSSGFGKVETSSSSDCFLGASGHTNGVAEFRAVIVTLIAIDSNVTIVSKAFGAIYIYSDAVYTCDVIQGFTLQNANCLLVDNAHSLFE